MAGNRLHREYGPKGNYCEENGCRKIWNRRISRVEIPVQRCDGVESLVIHCCDEACLYGFSPAVFYFEFPTFRCSADEVVSECLGDNHQFCIGAFAANDDFRCVKSVFFDERQCEGQRWTVILLIRNLYFDVFVVDIQSITFFSIPLSKSWQRSETSSNEVPQEIEAFSPGLT